MLLWLRQFFSGWFEHAECHDVTQPAETQDAFQRAVSGHIVSAWQEIKCRYQWNHGRNVLFIQNKTMLMRCFQCRVTMVDDLGGAAVIRCISKINIRNHTNHRRITKTAQSRAGGWTDWDLSGRCCSASCSSFFSSLQVCSWPQTLQRLWGFFSIRVKVRTWRCSSEERHYVHIMSGYS